MLRILSRLFSQNRAARDLLIFTVCTVIVVLHFDLKAQEFQEPKQEDVSAASENAKEAFNDAVKLSNSGEFLKALKQQQEQVKQAELTGVNGGMQIPQYFDEERNKRYLQQALGANAEIQTQETTDVVSPMVLVSFSMPESQLKALLIEASEIGAAVVLSGLYKDSFEETVKRVGEIAGRNDLGIAIDPTVFTRFDVQGVPYFILPVEPLKPCTESGCEKPKAVTAQGSATFEYFLEAVTRLGEKDEQDLANKWLAKVRKQ
jgi:type-F conjugative transfer system pilin assembly protein TrbC